MRWGSFYFPSKKDIVPLGLKERDAIDSAIKVLNEAKLPHKFFISPDVQFFIDPTIVKSGILGHTTFFKPNRVILSPLISGGLAWMNDAGIPNNEMQMSTVIHELTHLQQFRTWKLYGWMIIHLPFLNKFTVEKWANENGQAAKEFLEDRYNEQRRSYILKRRLT